MKYLLDTSVCVPLINRTDRTLRTRLSEQMPRDVTLCSVVRAELVFGAYRSERLAENLERVELFCRAFTSLAFDDQAAEHYGRIRAQLHREGRLIGANDMLIASIALSADVILVTRNINEFSRVPGLTTEAW